MSCLKIAKWKFNKGFCPKLKDNEYIIVRFLDGSYTYSFCTTPQNYNWKLNIKMTVLNLLSGEEKRNVSIAEYAIIKESELITLTGK
jgi:hypothetical protein